MDKRVAYLQRVIYLRRRNDGEKETCQEHCKRGCASFWKSVPDQWNHVLLDIVSSSVVNSLKVKLDLLLKNEHWGIYIDIHHSSSFVGPLGTALHEFQPFLSCASSVMYEAVKVAWLSLVVR